MKKTLYLIDGSGYLFRAFHALPPLTSAQGEPTGALFGVVNMIKRLLTQVDPELIAVTFDVSSKTFRNQLYPDYKANRPPMPDELRAQREPLVELIEALGIRVIRERDVEADDVIATLTRQAELAGMRVVISTGDKDLAQLVSTDVTLINTMSNTTLDPAGVIEKFGVRADQIVDFLALTGDSADNIPGVEKCGPKTAAKWLAEYESLDGVIANAANIGGKIGENLRAALPKLKLSQLLATVKYDVPLAVTVDMLTRAPANRDALRELYARFSFQPWLRELGEDALAPAPEAPTPPDAPAETHYECVLDLDALDAWIAQLNASPAFAFDTETTGLNSLEAELVGLSFAVSAGRAAYVPVAHCGMGAPKQLARADVLSRLKSLLEDASRPKVMQHGKYDLNVLSNHGIALKGIVFDTMLESYVLNSTASRHDMDSLAKKYLGLKTISFEDVAGKGAKQIGFAQVDLDTATRYAAEDADVTLRLHQCLWPRLSAEPKLQAVYEQLEVPLIPVLARMERAGIRLDLGLLKAQSRELETEMLALQQQAWAMAKRSFSLDSPKQLAAIFFDELKLPITHKTPTGQPSTNEEALEDLAKLHELPRVILDYRGKAKLKGTYTDKLPEMVDKEQRVHTSYHQAIAQTGRLSSSDPNLQNIPIRTPEGRRIRQAFIARDGFMLVAADYSQIELRIMAHLSQDPGFLGAFAAGEDIHRATAAEVFAVPLAEVKSEQRRAAKAINFGLIYGMSAFGLARNLNISRTEAGNWIERYFTRYPGVRRYMDETRAQAHAQGYVETVIGRRLYLNEIHSKNRAQRAGAERAAINAPMQGTAADIIKRAMIDVDRWLLEQPDDGQLLMQVHDELVLEVPALRAKDVARKLKEIMGAAATLSVPLTVDVGIGPNWDEAH